MSYPDPNIYREAFGQTSDTSNTSNTSDSSTLYEEESDGESIAGPLSAQHYSDPHYRPQIDSSAQEFNVETIKFQSMGYHFQNKLGQGQFGEVWRVCKTNAADPWDYREVAAKVLNVGQELASSRSTGQSVRDVTRTMMRDVEVLRHLRHPNLVNIDSVIHVKDQSSGFRSLFIVVFMSLCDQKLTEAIEQTPKGYMEEWQAKQWFKQVVTGLHYLHGQRVAHLDIKPDNILIKRAADGLVTYMLSDFGMAQTFAKDQPQTVAAGTSKHTNDFYQPPEVRNRVSRVKSLVGQQTQLNATAIDVYSLAVSLAESMICSLRQNRRINTWIVTGMLQTTPGLNFDQWVHDQLIWTNAFTIDHPVINLLRGMTAPDPSHRLTMDQIVKHKWIHRRVVFTDQQQIQFFDKTNPIQ